MAQIQSVHSVQVHQPQMILNIRNLIFFLILAIINCDFPVCIMKSNDSKRINYVLFTDLEANFSGSSPLRLPGAIFCMTLEVCESAVPQSKVIAIASYSTKYGKCLGFANLHHRKMIYPLDKNNVKRWRKTLYPNFKIKFNPEDVKVEIMEYKL